MADPDLRLQFHRTDPGPVLAHMRALAEAERGWVNLEPQVPDDVPVPGVGLFAFMSARGPAVPLCTWSAPSRVRSRRRPCALGVQHGTGSRAAGRLSERGLVLPDGGRVTQDHPRRGLVVEFFGDEPEPAVMLEWLLRAGELLSLAPPTGGWDAAVYLDAA